MKNRSISAMSQIDVTPPHEILHISPRPFDAESLFYRVNRAGVVARTTNNFHIRRNDTYCFGVVHCVFAGNGSLCFRGKEYPLSAGQLFLLPPFERHEYKSEPANPLGLCFVEFYGGSTAQLTQYILAHHSPIFTDSAFSCVLTYATSVLSRIEYDDWLNINLDIYGILTHLCENRDDGLSAEGDGIVQYINEHYTENLSLEFLASRFGYNPTYFSRKFHRLTGLPVSRYIIGRKVSRACYLLITTHMAQEEIAEALGFYDVSHMILRFKQIEGITPAQYRKQNHGLYNFK
ncbi:MAG: AraC family transcriptional regulator [Christensenella sp.]